MRRKTSAKGNWWDKYDWSDEEADSGWTSNWELLDDENVLWVVSMTPYWDIPEFHLKYSGANGELNEYLISAYASKLVSDEDNVQHYYNKHEGFTTEDDYDKIEEFPLTDELKSKMKSLAEGWDKRPAEDITDEDSRRNPLTEPAHAVGVAVTAGIVGAFLGALLQREMVRRKGD